MTEHWEKDFNGLEVLINIPSTEVQKYIDAAKKEKIRLEYKLMQADRIDIYTPKGEDMTLFWKALGKFQG